MASENSVSGQSSADPTRDQADKMEKSDAEKAVHDHDMTKLESMVTPEQVLSASVARKRRSVTKKRSQASGGGARIPRDKTPIRELRPDSEVSEQVAGDVPTAKRDIPTETVAEAKSAPMRPNRTRSRSEIKPSEVVQKRPVKQQPSQEIVDLLNVAKRSVSSERPRLRETSRSKRTVERKAIIKRSQSTPREQTYSFDDEDLIESFKKAQRLSAEVGTSDSVEYNSSDTSIDMTDEDSLSEEEPRQSEADLLREKLELKEKLKLIKREQREKSVLREIKPVIVQEVTAVDIEVSPKTGNNSEIRKRTRDSLPKETSTETVKKPSAEKSRRKSESKPSKTVSESVQKTSDRKIFRNFIKDAWTCWREYVIENELDYVKINSLRNRCVAHLVVLLIFCGLGGFVFRFTEGAFESFYKCGVKRVKRDFIDSLWHSSHGMREDDWKSMARHKLMDFEEQLHTAHEAGVHTYSGQRSWSFLNAVVYCLTVVTTIGYGHITPATTTGRAITIIYAIFGIPMFLILLADFGKLFTRGIKFVWAFVRRLYYTGSCRKVRKTETVQDVMKGVQMVYEIATFRRPSQINMDDIEVAQQQQAQKPPGLGTPPKASSEGDSIHSKMTHLNIEGALPIQIAAHNQLGNETPNTPAPSNFAVDDEFNLPVSVAIVILVLYLLSGASIYYMWENWSFFESFYFVFISMSTIGFGDFVPNHPMYMMASILYLVFGLALTSMCINVVQVKLSDTFRQASAKIGATIGLTTMEDDGSITQPQTAAPMELAEVHTAGKKDNTPANV